MVLGLMLFLGAGASKPFGPPTMPEYPQLFEGFLEKREPNLLSTYDRLRGVLKVFPDGNDLEALYSILQDLRDPRSNILSPAVAYQLSVTRSITPAEIAEALGETMLRESIALLQLLEEFILSSCELKHEEGLLDSYRQLFAMSSGNFWRKLDGGKSGIQLFERPVSCRSNPPGWLPEIPIVTTNYDLAVERYLNYRLADFIDGFEKAPGGRTIFNPLLLREKPKSPAIRLVKLHGSIDWKRTDDGDVILGEGRAGTVTRRWERISGEAMVFPTRNKTAMNRPFFELMTVFSEFLRESEVWLVIGYSFRDETLRRLFLDSLGEQRYLIVMSPHASKTVEKLRSEAPPRTSLNRIVPVDAEFGTAQGMGVLKSKIDEGF